MRELANVLVEETEKTHPEIVNDELYRDMKESMTAEELQEGEVKTLTYFFDRNHNDELLMEYSTEGLGDYANEELTRWTAGHKVFGQENMDLHYEQDMTNYPDSNFIFNFSV
jgi:hypothetical protein